MSNYTIKASPDKIEILQDDEFIVLLWGRLDREDFEEALKQAGEVVTKLIFNAKDGGVYKSVS